MKRRESLRTSAAWHAEREAERRRVWLWLGVFVALVIVSMLFPCTGAGGFDCQRVDFGGRGLAPAPLLLPPKSGSVHGEAIDRGGGGL